MPIDDRQDCCFLVGCDVAVLVVGDAVLRMVREGRRGKSEPG